MGISHAGLAHSSPDEAHSVVQLGLSEVIAKEPVTTFEKLNPSADDVRSVRERVVNEDVTVALLMVLVTKRRIRFPPRAPKCSVSGSAWLVALILAKFLEIS
jgi:hypothetical protein